MRIGDRTRVQARRLVGVADDDIGQAVAVDVADLQAIALALFGQPVADVAEAALAVAEEDLVALVLLGREHHVDMAVAIEVGEAHMLVVMLQPAEHPLFPGQPAGPVVEVEAAETHLDGDGDIEIAVLIDIGQGGVEAVQVGRDRDIGGSVAIGRQGRGRRRGGRRLRVGAAGDEQAGQDSRQRNLS